MGVKHKTIKNDFPKMKKQIEELDGQGVEVGVIRGEHAWLAPIHEYGLNILVTPKMRAYLHRQGLHLKASTTHIKIPERSFLRTGYDENRKYVCRNAGLLLADVVGGTMTADECCELVGSDLVERIKDYAEDLKNPANHPFTVENKNSSNPLIDSGQMIGQGLHWRKAK